MTLPLHTSLKCLSDEDIKSLKILLLARFAPASGTNTPPPPHETGGIFSFYHYELYQALLSFGIATTPCNDIEFFRNNHHHYNYIFSVFNRIPNCRNSEVLISSFCEYQQIPYLGAPPNIRALAEDKYMTKLVAQSVGIPTLPGKVYRNLKETEIPPEFEGPYFIKPRFGAASEDIIPDSFQESWQGAKKQVIAVLENNKECLVEQGLPGTDVTVPILGGYPPVILPCAEEISEEYQGISTFRQKRNFDKKRQRIILEDPALCGRIQAISKKLYSQVNEFDYMRIDFRLNENRDCFYLLEFNICCNLGSYAAIALTAKHCGISHDKLINHILKHSLDRQD